jgi:ABC-2 type transport system permease protein
MSTARDSWLITGHQLRALRMDPARLVYPIVQPLVLLVLFVSVFGNLALTRHGGSYREFLIPGILLENAALTAPVTGLGPLRDVSSGLADRFRCSTGACGWRAWRLPEAALRASSDGMS